MADKSKTVIVKKIKKGHGGGHHGGSWKVAYADFVTAMMAFFLLLWLLTMSSSEKRAVLAQYFKHFSLFTEAGSSFMKESSEIFQQAGGEIKAPSTAPGKEAGEISPEAMKEKLKKAVQSKLGALKDQVIIDIFEGGVRIQIVDKEGSSMFASGSAQPTERARQILKMVSENIKGTLNRIAVEGHTDSAGSSNTNWDLSSARASAARRELESNGIHASRISRVVGYADTELLFKDQPNDPRNRRISIILLQPRPQDIVPPPPEPSLEPQARPDARVLGSDKAVPHVPDSKAQAEAEKTKKTEPVPQKGYPIMKKEQPVIKSFKPIKVIPDLE